VSDQLKPCPHCGSTNVGLPFDDRECAWVTCRDCECDGPLVKGGFDNAKAIEGWNRRTPTPCPHCRSTNNAPDSLKCDDCGRDL
jgi:Lar family restriction alleviation protein